MRRLSLHRLIQRDDFCLQGVVLSVDVCPTFLDALKSGLKKCRGFHQALQVDPRVLHLEILVLEKQLFLSRSKSTRLAWACWMSRLSLFLKSVKRMRSSWESAPPKVSVW